MSKPYHLIRTIEESYMYAIDCQIASLSYFVTHKSVSKNERKRHFEITRRLIYLGKDCGLDVNSLEKEFKELKNYE